MPGQSFERDLVNAFNSYFEESGTRAIAYRNKQFRFVDQNFDIYVDSRDLSFYLAIECKSVDALKTQKLYFTQHFHGIGPGCQIERCSEVLRLSGRNGFLAVEARRKRPIPNKCWLVPWQVVYHEYQIEGSGLWPEQITYAVELQRKGGAYVIDDNTVNKMVKYMQGPVIKRTTSKSKWK